MTCIEAFRTLQQAFRDDPEYAHTWHCNAAMSFYGAMPEPDHAVANDGATRFMKLAFDVETSAASPSEETDKEKNDAN